MNRLHPELDCPAVASGRSRRSPLARWPHLLGVLLLTMALAACSGTARGSAPAPPIPAAGGQAAVGASGGGTIVNVAASNFAFSLDTTRASAGAVTFVVRNDSPAEHDFAIRGQGVDRKTPMLKRGETASLTVELRPGTYTYVCTVGGHERLGMHGTFTVA